VNYCRKKFYNIGPRLRLREKKSKILFFCKWKKKPLKPDSAAFPVGRVGSKADPR
jgi:hypothetical protein